MTNGVHSIRVEDFLPDSCVSALELLRFINESVRQGIFLPGSQLPSPDLLAAHVTSTRGVTLTKDAIVGAYNASWFVVPSSGEYFIREEEE